MREKYKLGEATTTSANIKGTIGGKAVADADMDFPVEIVTTVTHGHYHFATVSDDGSGATTDAYDESHNLIESPPHTIKGYTMIETAEDGHGGHTHEIADDVEEDLNTESNELNEADESKIIQKMREILKNKQFQKINGMIVDSFTASAVVQVYDKVNESNKKKMNSMKLEPLVNLVWKLIGAMKK